MRRAKYGFQTRSRAVTMVEEELNLMDQNQAVFVGFFPKHIYKEVEYLDAPAVKGIYSVSECISESPENWVDKWAHNDLGFFDTEDLAKSVIPPGEEPTFEILAFELFPMRFEKGGIKEYLPKLQLDSPDFSSYEMIGYDLISKSIPNHLEDEQNRYAFECSPLSCNHRAKDYPVNTYCLLDDYAVAISAGLDFVNGGGEPGPYYLFRVWKKNR